MKPDYAAVYLTFLRSARAAALQDSENFDQLVHAFERIGSMEKGEQGLGLNKYRDELMDIASGSGLAMDVPAAYPALHIRAEELFELLKERRNAAIHEGSVARNLVTELPEKGCFRSRNAAICAFSF